MRADLPSAAGPENRGAGGGEGGGNGASFLALSAGECQAGYPGPGF